MSIVDTVGAGGEWGQRMGFCGVAADEEIQPHGRKKTTTK